MSKFLNISTDTTLGGNSASDEVVSSQKAVKDYVDSQTGTAPAFANITGQPTDNANLASALNAKYDASNPNGYQANVIETVKVNGTALTPTNKAVDVTVPSAVTEATVSGWGFTKNAGTVTSVNNTQPDANGNVSLSIPTVNDATLTITQGGTTKGTFTANASSDVTIALDAGGSSSYTAGNGIDITNDVISVTSPTLTNTATGYSSLSILGTPTTYAESVNIGVQSYAYNRDATVVGYQTQASGEKSIALGFNARASGTSSIQLGSGQNIEPNSFYVGTANDSTKNWKMLGNDGLIPDARISSNIARTSSIPTVDQTYDGTSTNAQSGVAVAQALSSVSVSKDNKSITENANNQLQTVGVINSRDSSTAVKTWTGTKAQYDAIVTKDANTLYNITDDTSVTQTILETLYPVGSIYITTASTCPLSTLISGSTWELVSSGRVLQGADSGHSVGTTVEAGLPNITGGFSLINHNPSKHAYSGAFITPHVEGNYPIAGIQSGAYWNEGWGNITERFDASVSNSIYGNSSTVQPPAYFVNIYRRTA